MTPRSTVRGRPLHVVTNPTVGLNLHIRRGQEKICWNASAAYLAGSDTLPAGWPGSDDRSAGTARPPGWVARFRCPARWLGSVNLHVGSVRIPGSMILLGCPCGWLGSTNLIVGSIRLPGCWIGTAGRMPGTSTLTHWLSRYRCPTGGLGKSSTTPRSPVHGRPLCVLTNTAVGQNLQIML